jgi:hypothetical protein
MSKIYCKQSLWFGIISILLGVIIISYNTKANVRACPRVLEYFATKEQYGVQHAYTAKHIYAGNCGGYGNVYQQTYVGHSPNTLIDVKKSNYSNQITGWSKIDYKFKTWTGYTVNCYFKQTGSSSQGYTGKDAKC